jgi:hypothetical protein
MSTARLFPEVGLWRKLFDYIGYTGHPSKAMQYGCLTPNLLSGLDLTEIDSYCTD